jgi:hypothetical protein
MREEFQTCAEHVAPIERSEIGGRSPHFPPHFERITPALPTVSD